MFPLRSAGALASRIAALVMALGGALLAYRGLVDVVWETSGVSRQLEEVENLLFEPTGSSPEIVFAVVLWLAASRLRELRRRIIPPSWIAAGLALLLGGVAAGLCLWAYRVEAFDLLVPSLSAAILSAAAGVGGLATVRLMLLPSLVLLFAFPLPSVLVNELIWPLQMMTAEVTTHMVRGLGIDAVRSGDYILTPGYTFQVIESCAGLRTAETLLLAAVLYASLFYRGRLQAMLLVLLTLPMALLVNWLRVTLIVLAPEAAEADWAHTGQGLAMIVLGVLFIGALDVSLARLIPSRATPSEAPPDAVRGRARGRLMRRLAVVGAALSLLALTTFLIPSTVQSRAMPRSLTPFPTRLGEWSGEVLAKDRVFLGSVNFHQSVSRTYTRAGHPPVALLIGSGNPLDRSSHVLTPKLRVPGPGWEVLEQERTRFAPGGQIGWSSVVGKGSHLALVHHWYWGVDSFASELARTSLGLDRTLGADSLHTPVAVRLSTPFEPGARDRARERLEHLGRLVGEALHDKGFVPKSGPRTAGSVGSGAIGSTR